MIGNFNGARQAFKEAGLSYTDIGSKEFYLLRALLEAELAEHTRFPMKVGRVKFSHDERGALRWGEICVNGAYFKNRSGFIFNYNGEIEFTGWTGSENDPPFLNAFTKWIKKIGRKKCQ